MKIGFDAKRIYQNTTGLGNFARTLLDSYIQYFPKNEYYLFAPKKTNLYNTDSQSNVYVVTPKSTIGKAFKSFWRSKLLVKGLLKNNIEVYHGLSFELPFGINKTNIKTVVSIHDLIFERYPHQYKKIDVLIHRYKAKYAAKIAHKIITISSQTKQDIVDLYKIDANKIEVCYPSFDEKYLQQLSDDELNRIQQKYNLPKKYFLYVGSIIERKGLLYISKAIKINENKSNIPLVVIGKGGNEYYNSVQKYILENKLNDKIIFLNNHANADEDFKNSNDFPAIFQQAVAMIYPSVFEGFGIPVVEAIASKIPVITSNVSCLPEAGGNAALLVNPTDAQAIANAMFTLENDDTICKQLIANGEKHIQQFLQKNCAKKLMDIYKNL